METPVSITEALGHLPPQELERLKYCFENGTCAFVKLKVGLYIGVHMDQLPHMEAVETEGRWSLCRKLVE